MKRMGRDLSLRGAVIDPDLEAARQRSGCFRLLLMLDAATRNRDMERARRNAVPVADRVLVYESDRAFGQDVSGNRKTRMRMRRKGRPSHFVKRNHDEGIERTCQFSIGQVGCCESRALPLARWLKHANDGTGEGICHEIILGVTQNLDNYERCGQNVPDMGQNFDLEAMADFVATAEAGSITAGARLRGQPKQTTSRRLLAMEQELDVRLFDRTTRSLRLTEEGQLLLDRARRILADADDVRRTLSARSAKIEGHLRISAPSLLGNFMLGALAAHMLAAYPGLRLDINLSERRVDLVEEGFDAAIRIGYDDDSNLISRVLTTAGTVIVAAPSALSAFGMPNEPNELSQRPCILFGHQSGRTSWTLRRDAHVLSVDVEGRLTSNSLKLCLDAAVAGAGFANVPAFVARPLVDDGMLVHILPDWDAGRFPLRVVYPSRRYVPARLRAFVDEAAAAFRRLSL